MMKIIFNLSSPSLSSTIPGFFLSGPIRFFYTVDILI